MSRSLGRPFLGAGAEAGLGARPNEICARGEGRCIADVYDDADCIGDPSRAKSCVLTSSIGFLPKNPPVPEGGVPGLGEAPRLDIGDAPAIVCVSGNEILGFAFIFSVLPPNLNKPILLGLLRSDEVEVEVGREVGIDLSLEWDEVVVLWASSPSSGSRAVVEMGLGAEVAAGVGFGLELGLGLGRGLGCGLVGCGETVKTDRVGVGANTGGGVALVVANLAAIGGNGTLGADAEAEAGVEPEPEDTGIDVDGGANVDNGKDVVGIGGTTGVAFVFRLKNDGDFFGLPESESLSVLDFDDALVFLEETEENETASERYAPSLAASVS